MYLLYGHQISAQDPLVEITYEALGMFSGSVVPGTLIVNVFPFCKAPIYFIHTRHNYFYFYSAAFPCVVPRPAGPQRPVRQVPLTAGQNARYSVLFGEKAHSMRVPTSQKTAIPDTSKKADDNAVPSWVSELLERTGDEAVPENNIKALGAITLAAAMETASPPSPFSAAVLILAVDSLGPPGVHPHDGAPP